MKLPNFRLYNNQATAGVFMGIMGVICLGALMYTTVGRGFVREHGVIYYDPNSPWGQYRNYIVWGLTVLCVVLGAAAGLLGFNSLGQKRNTVQARSWLSLALGAFVVAVAPVFFLAWRELSEAVI